MNSNEPFSQPVVLKVQSASASAVRDLRKGICLGTQSLQGSQDFALEQLRQFNVFGTLGLYYLGEVHSRVIAEELYRVDVRVAAKYKMVSVF